MASKILFDRKWKIVLQIMEEQGNKLVPVESKTKELKDLRVTFNIKNTVLGDASLANFQIYNINKETENLLASHNCYLTFKTGYFSDLENSWDVLFYGGVTNSYEIRQKNDRVWNVWARNAMTLLDSKNPSFDPLQNEVTVKEALEKLTTDAVGLKNKPSYIGGSSLELDKLDNLVEYTPVGTFREEFNDLLLGYGFAWYVENDELVVYNKTLTDPTSFDNVPIEVSNQTGLLTVPIVDYTGVKFTTILRGELKPNKIIDISPNTIKYNLGNEFYVKQFDKQQWRASGQFRIMEINHKGDTRGDKWDTDVTAFYRRNN